MAQDFSRDGRAGTTREGDGEHGSAQPDAGQSTQRLDIDAALAARRGDEPPPPAAEDLARHAGDDGAAAGAGAAPGSGASAGAAGPDTTRPVDAEPATERIEPVAAHAPREHAGYGDYHPAVPAGSPLDTFDDQPERRSRRGWWVTAVVVAVLALAYAGAAWFLGDRVPNGAVVAGVPVGGMTEADAKERLEAELGPVAAETIPVIAEGSDGSVLTSIDPASVGMSVDVDGTVDPLTGFTLDPRVLWGRVAGMGAVEAETTVDEAALTEAVRTAATDLAVAPVEGAIMFEGASVVVTEPVLGTEVDVEAATETLADSWLTAERPIALPTNEVEPVVGADAVNQARTELAEPLVSGPVAVSVGEELAELSPEQLASAASFTAVEGRLDLQLDGQVLADAVTQANPEIIASGEDAKIVFQDGRPTIIPSTTGRGFEPDQLAAAVLEAGTSGNRTAAVELVEAEPEFTTAEAEALGVKEIVVEFSTPMPPDPVRTQNLVEGSRKVTGVLVMPGERFSLLDHIAPVSEANGYVSSGVVEDGFATTAVGGGLSQLSTNMFNIGFLAGMDDVTHTPHTRWFDRYPAGREATVWEPSIDMVWRNNTDFGVMIESWVADGRLHSRLWGTKVWEVRTSTSEHYNLTEPKTVYNPDPECKPEEGGKQGFTVKVTRQRLRDGSVVDDESWTTTYRPWNHVICGEPPAGAETATETPPEG